MSRVHVYFSKSEQTDKIVVYKVLSPDFKDMQLIGEVIIDLAMQQYDFVPLGVFSGKELVPLNVFSLPEQQQEEAIRNEFSDCLYNGWLSRIARMVSRLLKQGKYPDEVFGVT